MTRYLPRLLAPLIRNLLAELPALLVVGPRATGKTPTGLRHGPVTIRIVQNPKIKPLIYVSRTDAFAGPILPDLAVQDKRCFVRILPRATLTLESGQTHVVDLGRDRANPTRRCWVLLSTRTPAWRDGP